MTLAIFGIGIIFVLNVKYIPDKILRVISFFLLTVRYITSDFVVAKVLNTKAAKLASFTIVYEFASIYTSMTKIPGSATIYRIIKHDH